MPSATPSPTFPIYPQAIRAFAALPVRGFDGRAPRRPFPGAGVLLGRPGRSRRPHQEDRGGEEQTKRALFLLKRALRNVTVGLCLAHLFVARAFRKFFCSVVHSTAAAVRRLLAVVPARAASKGSWCILLYIRQIVQDISALRVS